MKKIIIGIIIGILLTISINFVGASIESTGVMYNSKTLNTVLDDLYSKIEEINNTGDASSSDILNGKTALVKGEKVTGTMPSYADDGYYYVGTNVGYINNNIYLRFPAGAYLKTNATGFVETWTEAKNIGLTADKIAKGQSVAGIEGTYTGNTIVKLGEGTSFNVSSYSGYQNFTTSNFIVSIKSASSSMYITNFGGSNGWGTSCTPTVSYNASTGIVSVSNTSGSTYNNWNGWGPTGTISISVSYEVYLIY